MHPGPARVLVLTYDHPFISLSLPLKLTGILNMNIQLTECIDLVNINHQTVTLFFKLDPWTSIAEDSVLNVLSPDKLKNVRYYPFTDCIHVNLVASVGL